MKIEPKWSSLERTISVLHEYWFVYIATALPLLHLLLSFIEKNFSPLVIAGVDISVFHFPITAALMFVGATAYLFARRLIDNFCPDPIRLRMNHEEQQEFISKAMTDLVASAKARIDCITWMEQNRLKEIEERYLSHWPNQPLDETQLKQLQAVFADFFMSKAATEEIHAETNRAIARLSIEQFEKEAPIARSMAALCVLAINVGVIGSVIDAALWLINKT